MFYQETLYPAWRQTFEVQEVLYEEKSDFWEISIFQNPSFGKILAIDGTIQLTENDEFIYHEMMAHVPLFTHPNPKSCLIIGGGDGGLLREVLRHEELERIVQVEIDPTVIKLSKEYLPSVSNGAYDNPRATLIIQDAAVFVKEVQELFDVIFIDSNDPEGAAKVLFSEEFYGDCKKILKPGGILVNQNGVPFMQKSELKLTFENRKPHFNYVEFFLAPVPTYIGGFMAFGFASDEKYHISGETIRQRLSKIKGEMKYYTPEIHKASFALPTYMKVEF